MTEQASKCNLSEKTMTWCLKHRINWKDLHKIRVEIKRLNVPKSAKPLPFERDLDNPFDLVIHRYGEGEKPIFERDDIVVNEVEISEERLIRKSPDKSNEDEEEIRKKKYSRSRSPSSPNRRNSPSTSKGFKNNCSDDRRYNRIPLREQDERHAEDNAKSKRFDIERKRSRSKSREPYKKRYVPGLYPRKSISPKRSDIYRHYKKYSRSPEYSRSLPRRRSRSPPRRYSRSPPRKYNRSPRRSSRSPRRSSRSPRRSSKSPRGSRTPRRSSRSPRKRSRSRRRSSRSSRDHSRSLSKERKQIMQRRSKSRSPRFRAISKRSRSPEEFNRRHRSEKRRSRSHERATFDRRNEHGDYPEVVHLPEYDLYGGEYWIPGPYPRPRFMARGPIPPHVGMPRLMLRPVAPIFMQPYPRIRMRPPYPLPNYNNRRVYIPPALEQTKNFASTSTTSEKPSSSKNDGTVDAATSTTCTTNSAEDDVIKDRQEDQSQIKEGDGDT